MDVVDPRTIRVRRRLEGVCLALAGVLIAVAFALSRSFDSTAEEVAAIADDRAQFVASNSLLVAGALLLVPGSIGIAQLLRGRGSGLLTTAAAMIGVGGASLALGLWSYTIAGRLLTSEQVPRDIAVQAMDTAYDDPVIGVVWLIGMGIFLGTMLCGVALLRVPVVPRWLAGLLIAAPVIAFLGSSPGGIITLLATLPLTVALAALGLHVARLPEPGLTNGSGAHSAAPAVASPAPREPDPSEGARGRRTSA